MNYEGPSFFSLATHDPRIRHDVREGRSIQLQRHGDTGREDPWALLASAKGSWAEQRTAGPTELRTQKGGGGNVTNTFRPQKYVEPAGSSDLWRSV